MPTQRTNFMSPEEYVARERLAERKSEYCNGEIFAMSGASRRHVLLTVNLAANLGRQLDGRPCEVYSSDMRLGVAQAGLFTYPDLMVTCGKPQFADDQKDTLLNPTVIVEVLSDSTRNYDTGKKFEYYRSLPSLMEYLTVEQNEPSVSHWSRGANSQWEVAQYSDLTQSLTLKSIGCSLALSSVYKIIEWPGTSDGS